MFWITRMKIDGFRFRSASVFTLNDRKSDGGVDLDQPSNDLGNSCFPRLATRRPMIAEAGTSKVFAGKAFPGIKWRHGTGSTGTILREFCGEECQGAWER